MESKLYWRGSVRDFATDICGMLRDDQIQQLCYELKQKIGDDATIQTKLSKAIATARSVHDRETGPADGTTVILGSLIEAVEQLAKTCVVETVDTEHTQQQDDHENVLFASHKIDGSVRILANKTNNLYEVCIPAPPGNPHTNGADGIAERMLDAAITAINLPTACKKHVLWGHDGPRAWLARVGQLLLTTRATSDHDIIITLALGNVCLLINGRWNNFGDALNHAVEFAKIRFPEQFQ